MNAWRSIVYLLMSMISLASSFGSGRAHFRVGSFRPSILALPKNRPFPHCSSRSFKSSKYLSTIEKPNFSAEAESKYFEYKQLEQKIYSWWESKGYFKPNQQKDAKSYVIPMPPPNVTGYLHMGHAIFIALQDILARFYRMKGYSTLWLPGT